MEVNRCYSTVCTEARRAPARNPSKCCLVFFCFFFGLDFQRGDLYIQYSTLCVHGLLSGQCGVLVWDMLQHSGRRSADWGGRGPSWVPPASSLSANGNSFRDVVRTRFTIPTLMLPCTRPLRCQPFHRRRRPRNSLPRIARARCSRELRIVIANGQPCLALGQGRAHRHGGSSEVRGRAVMAVAGPGCDCTGGAVRSVGGSARGGDVGGGGGGGAGWRGQAGHGVF